MREFSWPARRAVIILRPMQCTVRFSVATILPVAHLLVSLALSSSARAATGPIRVLYFDATGSEQTTLGPLHDAMRELGRDAIWFDYATGATPAAATLKNFDALVVRPNADGSPA